MADNDTVSLRAPVMIITGQFFSTLRSGFGDGRLLLDTGEVRAV